MILATPKAEGLMSALILMFHSTWLAKSDRPAGLFQAVLRFFSRARPDRPVPEILILQLGLPTLWIAASVL